MPYQVSRADTGQFVLTDSATDTVVIDDDLSQGFARLEQAVVGKPTVGSRSAGADPAASTSAFAFRGSRYTPILLAVVLPFAWLAVLYFALANLLAETALDRRGTQERDAKIEALERELQNLRSEIAPAPRKQAPKPARPKPKPEKPKAQELDRPAPEPGAGPS